MKKNTKAVIAFVLILGFGLIFIPKTSEANFAFQFGVGIGSGYNSYYPYNNYPYYGYSGLGYGNVYNPYHNYRPYTPYAYPNYGNYYGNYYGSTYGYSHGGFGSWPPGFGCDGLC